MSQQIECNRLSASRGNTSRPVPTCPDAPSISESIGVRLTRRHDILHGGLAQVAHRRSTHAGRRSYNRSVSSDRYDVGPANPPRSAQQSAGTRRRGAALTRAIYLATLEQLAATSFEELRFDKIAMRAGTGKAALYRRWDVPAQLVLAALSDPETGFCEPTAPATGSLREDLTLILGGLAQSLTEPRGRALRPLLSQHSRHPDLFDQVFDSLIVPHQRVLLDVAGAAAERGEADPRAVTQRIASVGPRLIIMESMHREPVPQSEVSAIVDDVLLPLMAIRS